MTDDPLNGYEIVNDRARISTEYLFKIHEKLLGGAQVDDINSEAALKFIEAIIRVWRDLYPEEYQERLDRQRNEWIVERTVSDANKQNGGYFVASIPPRVWSMLKIFFPNVKWTNRKNSNLLTSRFPILKGTQYKT